jgi:hypothetical protein
MSHGEELFCSHQTCRNGGVKFRFCTVCQVPVAKRNFRKRHMHGMQDSKTPRKRGKGKRSLTSQQQSFALVPPLSQENEHAPKAKNESATIGTPSQEIRHAQQVQQKQVDKPPSDFANEASSGQDLSRCSSLSSDGEGGMMDGDADAYEQSNDNHRISELPGSTSNNGESSLDKSEGGARKSDSENAAAKDSNNSSSNQAQDTSTKATSKQQVQVNEWLDLLWERPAANDDEGMSLWMERVRRVGHMQGADSASSDISSTKECEGLSEQSSASPVAKEHELLIKRRSS